MPIDNQESHIPDLGNYREQERLIREEFQREQEIFSTANSLEHEASFNPLDALKKLIRQVLKG